MKKLFIFSILTVLCLMLVLASCGGPAAVASGECGDSAKWSLDENGILTISGSGEMKPTKVRPWDEYKKDIVEIVIGDGITAVSGLESLYTVEKVSIGKGVKTIGSGAFSGLYS